MASVVLHVHETSLEPTGTIIIVSGGDDDDRATSDHTTSDLATSNSEDNKENWESLVNGRFVGIINFDETPDM